MIREAYGNLLDLVEEGHFDIIAHGCNCQNVMGAGLAKQIKDKYPQVEIADYRYWKEVGKRSKLDMLGNFSYMPIENPNGDFIIANLYTQLVPGPAFKIEYLRYGLVTLLEYFGAEVSYAIPRIGCGYGGGNWNEVKELIYKIAEGYNLTIIHYDN